MPRSSLLARLVLAAALLAPVSALAAPSIIYVTRHGEKAADGKDPDLTAQGHARARTIATMLSKAGIKGVYSSTTTRTRQTGQPTATQAGVELQLYDPSKPQALIDKVKTATGAVLVVGHSNTVPDLVRMMGGAPGTPIADDEFDRLYQLIVNADGSVTTVLLTSVAAP
jgi:broad specificity phosphatase PhoE